MFICRVPEISPTQIFDLNLKMIGKNDPRVDQRPEGSSLSLHFLFLKMFSKLVQLFFLAGGGGGNKKQSDDNQPKMSSLAIYIFLNFTPVHSPCFSLAPSGMMRLSMCVLNQSRNVFCVQSL
jgi:hypothetical protein